MIKATYAQVQQHNDKNSVWVVIKGKIYDVTSFLHEHPGGEEVLREHAGTNATEAFDDIGHSLGAREMLREYCIGEVVQDEAESNFTLKPAAANRQPFVGAIIIVLSAVCLYYLFTQMSK